MKNYQMFAPYCGWTHVLAVVIVFGVPLLTWLLAGRAGRKARRRAQYRRQAG